MTRCLAILAALLVALGTWPGTADSGEITRPDAVYPIYVDSKWGFIDATGRVVADPTLDRVVSGGVRGLAGCHELIHRLHAFPPGPVPVFSGGTPGFVSAQGLRLFPDYDEIGFFSEGLAPARQMGKWGYINPAGEIAIEPRFDLAQRFREGASVVMVDGWWGLVGRDGAALTELSYDVIRPLTFGPYFMFETKGKQGVLDSTGQIVAPAIFDTVYVVRDDLLNARIDGRMGYYSLSDQAFIIPPIFDSAAPFNGEIAKVVHKGKDAFIDRTGAFTYRPDFNRKWVTTMHYAGTLWRYSQTVRGDLRFGLFDGRDGTTIIAPKLEFLGYIVDGRAIYRDKGLAGYLDEAGRIAILAQFRMADDFSHGLARVGIAGGFGYVDRDGNMVAAFQDPGFKGGRFLPDLALVFGDGEERYINREGEVVYTFRSGCRH